MHLSASVGKKKTIDYMMANDQETCAKNKWASNKLSGHITIYLVVPLDEAPHIG